MTTPAETVTVYTNPGCGPCIGTKAKLRRLGVEFAEIDLSQDEQALAVLKARAAEQNKTLPAEKAIVISQAPVVTYGDTIWHVGPIVPARLEALAAKVKSDRPAEAPASLEGFLEAIDNLVAEADEIEIRTAA